MTQTSLLFLLSLLAPATCLAQGFKVEAKPDAMEVSYDGKLFTRYVTDNGEGNKPYLWPVIGPTGKEMTRAYPMDKTREGEAKDHPHHRSINFGHEDIAGFNTWLEKASYTEQKKKPEEVESKMAKTGTIQHKAFRGVKADPDHAVFTAVSDHLRADGTRFLTEETRYTFRATPDTRSIDIDMDLIASDGAVMVKDIKDAGYSVRVAHSMAVDSKQGGEIVNAQGDKNAEAWGTRSPWVDYHGPVGGDKLGVAFFNHPLSFRYPTPWHVRTYGLFTANPFGLKTVDKTKQAADGTFELANGDRIKLRHRIVFHKGDEMEAKVAELYKAYAAEDKK